MDSDTFTSKVFKRKSGKSKGRWTARLKFFDDKSGQWKTEEKLFDLKTLAVGYRDNRKTELEKTDGGVSEGEKITFAQLADVCLKEIFHPAFISKEGVKIRGIRSVTTRNFEVEILKKYFGRYKI